MSERYLKESVGVAVKRQERQDNDLTRNLSLKRHWTVSFFLFLEDGFKV
jgi:hypothetical protein